MRKTTIKSVVASAEKARDEWLSKYATEEDIREDVVRTLDSKFTSIVAGVLGFHANWPRWEIDRSSSNSTPIQRFIREQVQAHTKQWITDMAGELKLSNKDRSELRKAYLDYYKDELKRHVHLLAKEQAAEDARAIVDQICESTTSTTNTAAEE